MKTLREELIEMGNWNDDDELRHQVSEARKRDWREAQRRILADAGVPEPEIENRISALAPLRPAD